MSMPTPSESPQSLEQPEYEDLTDEQRKEYYEFSAALVIWLKQNETVRIAWGWTAVGKFLLVIGVGNNNKSLDVSRVINQEELWNLLDQTAFILRVGRASYCEFPSQADLDKKLPDEWDW
jgi:hypothetical protein